MTRCHIIFFDKNLKKLSSRRIRLGLEEPPTAADGSNIKPKIIVYKSYIYVFYPFNSCIRHKIDPNTMTIAPGPEKFETKDLIDMAILSVHKRSLLLAENKKAEFLFINTRNKIVSSDKWNPSKPESVPMDFETTNTYYEVDKFVYSGFDNFVVRSRVVGNYYYLKKGETTTERSTLKMGKIPAFESGLSERPLFIENQSQIYSFYRDSNNKKKGMAFLKGSYVGANQIFLRVDGDVHGVSLPFYGDISKHRILMKKSLTQTAKDEKNNNSNGSDIIHIYCDYLFAQIYCKKFPDVKQMKINVEVEGEIIYSLDIIKASEVKNIPNTKPVEVPTKDSEERRPYLLLFLMACCLIGALPVVILCMANKEWISNLTGFGKLGGDADGGRSGSNMSVLTTRMRDNTESF